MTKGQLETMWANLPPETRLVMPDMRPISSVHYVQASTETTGLLVFSDEDVEHSADGIADAAARLLHIDQQHFNGTCPTCGQRCHCGEEIE